MSDESSRFVALLDALDASRRDLAHTLDELERVIRVTRDAVRDGPPTPRIHLNGEFGVARRRVSEALVRMNSSLMACRAEGIRLMVEVDGMSLSEVSRVLGSSRQFVTRLYHKALSLDSRLGEVASS